MTIKPIQADFINYTYLFKGSYNKGIDAFNGIVANEAQLQAFLDNPAAIAAAFSSDQSQTPLLCEAVYNFGEEKRTRIANAYAVSVGYSDYKTLIESPEAPWWQRNIANLMTGHPFDEMTLNKRNFITSLQQGTIIRSWIGSDVYLGSLQIPNANKIDITFKVVGIEHDDKSDDSGKARYSLVFSNDANEDLTNSNFNHSVTGSSINLSKMNDPATNVGAWRDCQMRTNLNTLTFDDDELNEHVVSVKKLSGLTFGSTVVTETSDKFWLPSCKELNGIGQDVGLTESTLSFSMYEGDQYEYYKTLGYGAVYFKNTKNKWLRSRSIYSGSSNFAYVASYISTFSTSQSNTANVPCIGVCFD